MKILIAGYGSIGRRHLRNLRALGVSDLILLRSGRSTLDDAGRETAGLIVESSLEAALARQPDGVVIATPTALHMQTAIPAARQGCGILMEKPLDAHLERLPELRQALAAGGGQVLMGFQFRYHPTLRTAANLIAGGAIGRPCFARAHWGEYLPDWHPWEDYRQGYAARADLGGGVLRTLCHPFDYLRMLLGEYRVLSAHGGTLGVLGIEVEEIAEVCLRFANGALGSLHLDYLQRPPSHTLEISGEAGRLTWDNTDGRLRWFRADAHVWKEELPPAGFERNDLFLAEMANFLAMLRGEEAPRCGLDDGAAALEAVLAADALLRC